MTPAQFALAVGADVKWIQNARRILGRAVRSDPSEARWLGLVHELHGVLGCPLSEAAAIADEALTAPIGQRTVRIHLGGTGRVELTIDLWRDLTTHLALLSRARVMPPIDRRGRPSSTKPPTRSIRALAVEYGVDVGRLRAGLGRSVAERLTRLDDNVAFIAAGRASLAKHRARP
jgi:hypothetical protein